MLFQRRQFKTEQWDEEDELIYIRQGEPLSSINHVRFPPVSMRRRAQNPMNNAIFFIPLILVIWIFHPLHQFLTALFEGDDPSDDSLHSVSSMSSALS